MISLRDHIKRLLSVSHSLTPWASYSSISENLHLALSLDALRANTDIYCTSPWCRVASEFDEVNNELMARYLGGIHIFRHVWITYEVAIKMASTASELKKYGNSKGALGREVILRMMAHRSFPHLCRVLSEALEFHHGEKNKDRTNRLCQLIAKRCLAPIGSEHLRLFRNAVVHGDIPPPHPEDWGEASTYYPENDTHIRQLHTNTRLALILIQMLLREHWYQNRNSQVLRPTLEPIYLALTQLHCNTSDKEETQVPLEFFRYQTESEESCREVFHY